jgi:hypothetical protein
MPSVAVSISATVSNSLTPTWPDLRVQGTNLEAIDCLERRPVKHAGEMIALVVLMG